VLEIRLENFGTLRVSPELFDIILKACDGLSNDEVRKALEQAYADEGAIYRSETCNSRIECLVRLASLKYGAC